VRTRWRETRRQGWGRLALSLAGGTTVLGFGACAGLPGNGWLLGWVWRLGLSTVLVALAIWDWRAGLLPNRGTLPVIGLGVLSLAMRLIQRALPLTTLALVGIGWALCLLVWWLRIFRGGDTKLIMGLLALFPDRRFVWILLGILFAGALSAIVVREGRTGLRRLGALFYTVLVGRTLPTRDDIEASYQQPGGSHRLGYLFSLAGLACLWWAYPG
jgi:hypothetical protein